MANELKQDLLIVIDATASMGTYLRALHQSIPEILALSKLSGAFARIGVLAYRDYCDGPDNLLAWSGWNNPRLSEFAAELEPLGGGDYPEAAKTGLIRALEECDAAWSTLVLWYADAPPHAIYAKGQNAPLERMAFRGRTTTDWVELAFQAKEKRCNVFTFVEAGAPTDTVAYFNFLSSVTNGACVLVDPGGGSRGTQLSRVTLDIVLQWAGLCDWGSAEHDPLKHAGCQTLSYAVPPLSADPRPSSETNAFGFVPCINPSPKPQQMTHAPLDLSTLPKSTQANASHMLTIGKRFAAPREEAFRALVHRELAALIEANVFVLTYNPVFGQLWRAVCKRSEPEPGAITQANVGVGASDADEKEVPTKQALVDAFSVRVAQLADGAQKAEMQKWLEDSFDATEEIEELIAKANLSPGAPRLYLDLDSGLDLTRRELLEVSRSCYAGVLQKLTSVFTHLKLAEAVTLLTPNQRTLPLGLKPCDLFRALPHLVVAGTLFPARAAALTALLALHTSVPFLREPALAVLEPTPGTWLDLNVPENISYDCARFLLTGPEGVVLNPRERRVYAAMRRYRLLELNLDSTLKVLRPWTPERTREVGDVKVKCQTCGVRRSVTIMSHEREGVCGLCVALEGSEDDPARLYPEMNEMHSCWVECSVKTCRAQYIVEDVSKLLVRPKCHYCRTSQPCPFAKCTRCTNRVVLPRQYSLADLKAYLCPACANPANRHPTLVEVETNTRAIVEENGAGWLGLPGENSDVLGGKTAFKLVQAHGFEFFEEVGDTDNEVVKIEEPQQLTLGGKVVHNVEGVRAQIERRVGRGEVELGTCALCFDDKPRQRLIPSCGRRRCAHKVDETCLQQWYGANTPGKLLNTTQLMCPFCRRTPTSKLLSRFNRAVAALGGLRDALEDRAWYYAWCSRCGFARRALERRCCDGDRALPVLEGWACEECETAMPVRVEGVRPGGEVRVTPCPACGVMIEKTYGCNHIECSCGQHFCHVCGKASTADEIYEHMAEEHGSIYDEDADSDYD